MFQRVHSQCIRCIRILKWVFIRFENVLVNSSVLVRFGTCNARIPQNSILLSQLLEEPKKFKSRTWKRYSLYYTSSHVCTHTAIIFDLRVKLPISVRLMHDALIQINELHIFYIANTIWNLKIVCRKTETCFVKSKSASHWKSFT